jgi:electron transport complex protein RnfG
MASADPVSTTRGVIGTAARLGLITAGVVAALTWLDALTREPIARHERRARADALIELTGDARLAALPADVLDAKQIELCEAETRYRLVRGEASGYSGTIELVVALTNGTVMGVRVLRHSETPGLGDAIETDRSDWIRQLAGHPLSSIASDAWRVTADGGAIDALSGATITSRAVLDGVRAAVTALDDDVPCTPSP